MKRKLKDLVKELIDYMITLSFIVGAIVIATSPIWVCVLQQNVWWLLTMFITVPVAAMIHDRMFNKNKKHHERR